MKISQAIAIISIVVLVQCKKEKISDKEAADLLNTAEFDTVKIASKSQQTPNEYQIKSSYELVAAKENNDCKKFQSLFPKTFNELNTFYGFDDETGAKDLYYEGNAHIDYLFDCYTQYPTKESVLNILKIGLNGHWHADVISYFQRSLRKFILSNSTQTLNVISSFKETEIESLYRFLLDGPHPGNSTNAEFLSKLKLLDQVQYEIANQAFTVLKKESAH